MWGSLFKQINRNFLLFQFPALVRDEEFLIHNNNAIANVEKVHFIEPEKMVKMRKMTENNEVVWQLLWVRYDDRPPLVAFHLDSILQFRSLNKESDTDLREMFYTVIESLFPLEKLNVDTRSWDQSGRNFDLKKRL